MNFILNRSVSRKDSLKSTSIMSCDSSSSSSSSSSGCCSNLSSSTAQVSGGEEVCVSSSNINNSGKRKKSISSPCHTQGGVDGSSFTCITSHSSSCFSGSDLNSDRHSNLSRLSSRSPSTVPSSTNGSISSSFGVQSDIEFGPMGTIKKKSSSSSSSSSASTHLNGPVLPLTSITRSLAKHSSDDCLLVEINEDRVIRVNSGISRDNYNCNGNILLQSNVQYGTLKMRRSFRSKEVSPSFRDSSYSSNGYSNGGFSHRSFISHRSSQVTNTSSECSSSILSQPVHEEEEEMIRRMRRDSSNFDPEEEDGTHDDLPLPPPPDSGGGLTTSLSTLSLISLPPPPPEFSCATLDTNTLSSVSSSSPSSSSSTATHSLDRSCCNSGSNVSTRDNTLTRTNVRLHQEQQSSHQRQERAVVGSGNHCCQHRSSLSPSSASSSSYEEDISCDGRGCSKCPPMAKQQNRQMAKSGAVGNRYQCYGERINGHQVPCCSKSVVSNGKVIGGRAVPVRSVSCCTREVGAKQKILRSGSRDDSSSSFASSSASHHHQERSSHVHQHSSHLNHHPDELVNARERRRQYKATYSSSSSCSSRDGEDLSACSSMRECQSPEDVGRIQRLESFESVDNFPQNSSAQQHKTHAQARMKAKISGLNRSDQPIYDSVFTYRKQQPQLSQDFANGSTNVSSHGLSHESNHRLEPRESSSRQVSRGSEDYGELPLPPPPPELSSNQQFQEVPVHQTQQVPGHQLQQNAVHGNNEISCISSSSSQPVYGVVNKGNKNRKEEQRNGNPDSSFHHPVPVRSPMKGPLPPPPEEFVKNLHRVMEKKWKVAQALSGSDFPQDEILTTSFHPDSSLAAGQDQFASSSERVRMGFNDPSLLPHPPPPDPSHMIPTSQVSNETSQVSNETSHHEPLPPPPPSHHHQAYGNAAHHNSMIDSPSSVPAPPALTCLQPFQYQQNQYQKNQHHSPLYQQSQPFSQSQQSCPPSSDEDGGFYDVLPIAVRPFNGVPIHQGGSPPIHLGGSSVSGNSGHSFQHQLGGSTQYGINHHHAENGSSSSGSVFSRMIPFRRSSKVSSTSSPNSSVSNYSSSSTGGGNGSKGAPPPPPKRSDKTKLSQRK